MNSLSEVTTIDDESAHARAHKADVTSKLRIVKRVTTGRACASFTQKSKFHQLPFPLRHRLSPPTSHPAVIVMENSCRELVTRDKSASTVGAVCAGDKCRDRGGGLWNPAGYLGLERRFHPSRDFPRCNCYYYCRCYADYHCWLINARRGNPFYSSIRSLQAAYRIYIGPMLLLILLLLLVSSGRNSRLKRGLMNIVYVHTRAIYYILISITPFA